MIARVLFIWLPFSIALLLLGLYSQGEPFELQQFGLSLVMSLPVAVAVLRGGLGDPEQKQLQYPSATLMIVSAWIMIVAPSLIVESQAARYLYHYSEASLTLARVFFFAWCLLFTVAAGRPRLKELKVQPSLIDFVVFMSFALPLAAYLLRSGYFSAYDSASRSRLIAEAGSNESIAISIGLPLFTALPPLLFLVLMRMQPRVTQTSIVFLGFLGSWGLLFLLGSRTRVAVAIASCLLLCRCLGLRLRANVLVGLGFAMPAALVLMLIYRSALATSNAETSTVSEYISIASESTGSLNDTTAQSQAMDLVSNNMRVRLWYGQQFCVLVDAWLDEGAAMRGSLFSGVVASLPTLVMADKNERANELSFERILVQTQRFPEIDLAPTPWMQWLYELGILGILVGTILYAWLLRLLESRMSRTASFYEVTFWLQLFVAVLAPEHTTDWLVLVARTSLVLVILTGGTARILRWLASLGTRRATA